MERGDLIIQGRDYIHPALGEPVVESSPIDPYDEKLWAKFIEKHFPRQKMKD